MEYDADYYEKYKDCIKKAVKKYSDNNKDKISEKNRLYREKNKEREKERKKLWYQKKKHESELVEDYKIRAGNVYFVKRQEHENKVFYKIPLRKRNRDNTYVYCYKNVTFAGSPDIPDNSRIIPIKFVEDFYKCPRDCYNTIFTLVIYQWEYADGEGQTNVEQALREYEEFLNRY